MYYSPEFDKKFETQSDVRRFFVWIFFQPVVSDEDLAFFNIQVLQYEQPEVEPTQIAEPSNVLEIDGQWVQQWTIRDRTPEEMSDPEPEADPIPEDPPVDPEPIDPVQSGN